MQVIDKSQLDAKADQEKDLREYLTDHYYYVPVKSLPYRWLDGVPVAIATGI